MHRRILQIGLLLLTLLWALPLWAAEGRVPIHVQLVLDSSGSMVNNDPDRLSSLAGMIFSDLAGPGDSVGILSMRKGKFVTQPLAEIAARGNVNAFRFRGRRFDCGSKSGFLQATVAFGLAREDLRDEFLAYLRSVTEVQEPASKLRAV